MHGWTVGFSALVLAAGALAMASLDGLVATGVGGLLLVVGLGAVSVAVDER